MKDLLRRFTQADVEGFAQDREIRVAVLRRGDRMPARLERHKKRLKDSHRATLTTFRDVDVQVRSLVVPLTSFRATASQYSRCWRRARSGDRQRRAMALAGSRSKATSGGTATGSATASDLTTASPMEVDRCAEF